MMGLGLNLLMGRGRSGPSVPTPVISITSGMGYAGSTYTSTIAGQWTADGVAIPGETNATYVLSLANEGKAIRCGASNTIEMLILSDLGAIAWWDARQTALITLNVADVASWADRINSWPAIQATGANQPLYDAAGLNGKPAVTFTRANSDRLTIASGTTRAQPFTRGYLGQNAHVGANAAAIDGSGAGNRGQMYITSAGASALFAGTGLAGPAVTTNTPYIHVGQFNGVTSISRVNGTDGSTGTANTNPSRLGCIGGNSLGAEFYNGPIAQVFDYPPLSTPDVEKLEGCLCHMYELGTSFLALGHTYRAVAPRIQ